MGAFYQQANNIDSAIWAYRHVARLVPDYNSYQQLANTQLKAGRIEDAKASFYKSLEFDSTAKNVDEVIIELRNTKVAERSGRAQDEGRGMEQLRKDGYM